MEAQHEAWMQEQLFRVYASDLLKCIAKAQGFDITMRYSDFFTEQKQPEPERTADEIIADIITRGGLKVRP